MGITDGRCGSHQTQAPIGQAQVQLGVHDYSALVHDAAGVARLTDAVGRGEIVQRLMDKVEIQTTARFEPNGAAQCRWIASRLVLRKYFQNPEVTFPSELPGRPDKAEAWR